MEPGSPCPKAEVWRRWLWRWIDPSPQEQHRLAEHLEVCRECRRLFVAEYVRLQMAEFAGLDHFVPEVLARVERCLREPAQVREAAVSPPSPAEPPQAAPSTAAPANPAPSSAASPVVAGKPTRPDVSPVVPASQRPRILGNYCLRRRLGEGAMGVVFEAEDLRSRKRVALKLMKPELANNPTSRQRFLREAQVASAINHPNVVAIHEVGEFGEIPFIAMEYLVGESLRDRIKREGALAWREACRIAAAVADGLGAAHCQGLVHRDVKPANIWLQHPGQRVKLLDFGLVHLQDQDLELTQDGLAVGTPAYMSPEQIRGRAVDGRSDLFSLGVVLYESLIGERPFHGNEIMAVIAQVLTHHPPAPKQLRPDIPETVSDLVLQLLEKEAAARPKSAAEVAERLRQLVKEPTPARIEHSRSSPASAGPGNTAAPSSASSHTVQPTLGGMPWVRCPTPESGPPPAPDSGAGGTVTEHRPRKPRKRRPSEPDWQRWLAFFVAVVLVSVVLLILGRQLLSWFHESPGVVKVEVEEAALAQWKQSELRIYSDRDRIAAILRPDQPAVSLAPGRYWAVLPRPATADLEVDKFEFEIHANRTTALFIRLRRVNQPTMPFAETTKPEASPSRPIDGSIEREDQGR